MRSECREQKRLFDDVIKSGAELGEQLLGIDICVTDLLFHLREIDGPAFIIENSWRDEVAIAVVAQLSGDINCILDLNGLCVAESLLPGDAGFAIFFVFVMMVS